MHQTKLIFAVVALTAMSAGCAANVTDSDAESLINKEVEARETLNSILFDQRTYYLENRAFTTSLRDLETMQISLDSPNYRYAIQPKPSKQKGVSVTATPKRPNLRSFTGVVFALDAGKEKLTISEICETTKPSNQAPVAPTAPKGPRDAIQCPTGSISALGFLALQ